MKWQRGARAAGLCPAGVAAIVSMISCAAAPESRPATTQQLTAGPFLLQTTVAEPRALAAARKVLEDTLHVLQQEIGSPAQNRILTIRWVSSETERLAIQELESAHGGPLTLPASANRRTLTAVVATPRADLFVVDSLVPDLLLPDSFCATLAHEAAHLYVFAHVIDESRIPQALHEGFAEWVALQVASLERKNGGQRGWSSVFARESLMELRRAAESGALPHVEEWITTNPRESRSPQLWTALSLWHWQAYAQKGGRITDPALAGDDATTWFLQKSGLTAASVPEASELAQSASDELQFWSIGRDVSAVPGTAGLAPGFLLAPIPGKGVWLLEGAECDPGDFTISFEFTVLGGGAPELWVGAGFDDGRHGLRMAVTSADRVSVEPVRDGLVYYAHDVRMGSGLLRPGRPTRFVVTRRDKSVTFEIGVHREEVSMPREFTLQRGRFGIGAKGGAIVIRNLSIQRGEMNRNAGLR